jgi:magnesium transporter
MPDQAPDGRVLPPEPADISTDVSGAEGLSHLLAGVIRPEDAAEPTAAVASSSLVAWLFEAGAAPHQVGLHDLPVVATDDACFVWVDLSRYRPADLEAVARELDLPEAAVWITLAGWQRPRVSVFGDRFFVAVTVPQGEPETDQVLAGELDLFVGRNYLVSAHKQPLPFTPRVLARAVPNPALLTLDSAFLLSILVDELLAHYEALTEGLEDAIEALEERALTDTSDAFLEDLLGLKRFVFAIYRLASHHHPDLEAFLRPDFALVGGDAIDPYFRDLEARLGRLVDGLEAAHKGVNSAFALYVSQVGHRTNDIMKVLAIVSTVLLPATLILGFFGTQFEAPAGHDNGLPRDARPHRADHDRRARAFCSLGLGGSLVAPPSDVTPSAPAC